MQAVLLAGGLGTRLQSVVSDRPKPMALVNDKPFMEYLIEQLKKNGITDFVMAVGYKGSIVEDYFGDGTGFDVHITYSYEDEPLGTGGAIKNATDNILDNAFLVLNADTYYNIEYASLINQFVSSDSDMTIVLRKVSDISRYGMVVIEDDKVVGFNEKSLEHTEGIINGGVYLLNKRVLDAIPEGKCSLENDVIPKLIENEYRLNGYINTGYFIDIGIPEDYFRFIEDVTNGIV